MTMEEDAKRYQFLRNEALHQNALKTNYPWCVAVDHSLGVPNIKPKFGKELDYLVDNAILESEV